MAIANGVWGIDIGQCALKAVKLRPSADGKVEVVAFDIIEHPKILSQPDAEPDELIKAALEKFASRNEWQGDQFVIGVPGQQTFARFCKLPPADPKKLPDLVRYEAGQQIPFDMEDVVWDYQVFATPDSPDIEVGIFAMRKDLIRKHLEYFAAVGISPAIIQTIPSALYNFVRFDGQGIEEGGATVLIDVGAQNTDLIVAEKNSAWMRNIPLGGNSFTEALIKSFKLSFAKAESLKRTAASSKYARQIFQAMRPVFAELVAEIQRSLGFYSSTHRDVELKRVLALGNAFRLPGLQKYLENNLTISGGVAKLEKFNQVVPSATLSAPQFAENVLCFGSAYGLAVQGLDLAAISASLLPTELARVAVWRKKQPYFMAAAGLLVAASMMPWTRHFLDNSALASSSEVRTRTETLLGEARRLRQSYADVATNTTEQEENVKKLLELMKDKLVVPRIVALVSETLPELPPEVATAQSPQKLKQVVTSDPKKYARQKRKQIYIESFQVAYQPNIEDYIPPAAETGPGGGGGPSMGGAGGPRMGGGGGGGGGDPGQGGGDPTLQASAPATVPGFYIRVKGRSFYGDNQAEAARVFYEEYFKNIKQVGQKAGLGFFVMDEDPKNTKDKLNLRLIDIQPYYRQAVQATGAGAMLGGAPAAGGSARSAGGIVTDDAEMRALYGDPVTGEDARTDWRFDFGFKIKLGEKPAPPPAETPAPPT